MISQKGFRYVDLLGSNVHANLLINNFVKNSRHTFKLLITVQSSTVNLFTTSLNVCEFFFVNLNNRSEAYQNALNRFS